MLHQTYIIIGSTFSISQERRGIHSIESISFTIRIDQSTFLIYPMFTAICQDKRYDCDNGSDKHRIEEKEEKLIQTLYSWRKLFMVRIVQYVRYNAYYKHGVRTRCSSAGITRHYAATRGNRGSDGRYVAPSTSFLPNRTVRESEPFQASFLYICVSAFPRARITPA